MVEIRKMMPQEAREVQKIAMKAFTGIERFFVIKPKEAMVAVVDGKLVGGIIIRYIKSGSHKIGYFDGAFVHPDYHDKGIGSALYSATKEYLWEQNCTAQAALVKDDNVGSWKLFLNNGFARTSFSQGVKKLGLAAMITYYFSTPFFISNGMEFYLTMRDTQVQSKPIQTPKNLFLYLFINALLLLFGWIGSKRDYPVYLAAALSILAIGVFSSYIGTLFSKRNWHFRLNSGGALICGVLNFLGTLYPMIGTWYPEKYENSKDFRKDMGVTALLDWIVLLCISVLSFCFLQSHIYFKYLFTISEILLLYRIIAVYPFESFGGGRVFRWNKWIYAIMAIISLAWFLVGFIL